MTRIPGPSLSSREGAKEIARKTLEGKYDLLLACRDLANLRAELSDVDDDIIDTFIGVASEIDDLPIGGERERWSADALHLKDIEAEAYRERIKSIVEEALRRLLSLLESKH